jgi:hypothetical protein
MILSVASSWTQDRTHYGGISASLVYEAMREAVDAKKVFSGFNRYLATLGFINVMFAGHGQ